MSLLRVRSLSGHISLVKDNLPDNALLWASDAPRGLFCTSNRRLVGHKAICRNRLQHGSPEIAPQSAFFLLRGHSAASSILCLAIDNIF